MSQKSTKSRGKEEWLTKVAAPTDGIILEWLSNRNRFVQSGEKIARISHEGTVGAILAPCSGVFVEALAKPHDAIEKETPVAVINSCTHPILLGGNCTVCLLNLSMVLNPPEHYSKYAVDGPSGTGIEVSDEILEEERTGLESRLLAAKKLILVLDLDETLLHSHHPSAYTIPEDWVVECGLRSFRLSNERFLRYTKLRPGAHDFLKRMSKYFQIYIFTLGTKQYALKMAELLDPDFKYLDHDLIFSIDDAQMKSSSNIQKKLDHFVAFHEKMTVIMDDRIDVWSVHEENVLQIKKFLFFPDARFIQEQMSRSHKRGADGEAVESAPKCPIPPATDNHLASHGDMLVNIHASFYGIGGDAPTNNILDSISEVLDTILGGTCLLFSGVFEVGKDPSSSFLWKRAEKYGAACEMKWSEEVTHLVVHKDGSQKVHEALKKKVYIVSIDWLHYSISCAMRVDEIRYALGYEKGDSKYRIHNTSVRQFFDSQDGDGDEEEKGQKSGEKDEDEDNYDEADLD